MGRLCDSGDLRVLAAVPAYNCQATVGEVVRQCLTHLPDVLVVDDGSADATAQSASAAGARVLRHECNLGKGVAIRTAATETLRGGFTGLLTIDGDGQHDGDDLPRFLEAHRESSAALLVGWRREALELAPAARRFGNRFSNRALALLAGVRLPDTQCGLRLYPRELLRRLSLRGTRYETEAELLVKAQGMGWDLRPVPVRVRFADGRSGSHYRPWVDSARICALVTGQYLRRRLATRQGLAAGAAAAHAPLLAAASGVVGFGAAAVPALAFHLAMTCSLLRPRGQSWVETETDFRAAPGRAEVALTFDDGPDPAATPRVLEVLEREQVAATFFLIGRRVEQYPRLVAEMAARGHALGNHTYRHLARFSVLGRRSLAEEIDRAQAAIALASGRTPVLLRPPAGHKNLFLGRLLRERGMRCVAWSARAFDTRRRDPRAVVDYLAERARTGSILLLHDQTCVQARMPDALPRLIDRLRARGFQFVTLPGAA